ncbi:MAG: DUF167 domain-containing protein [Mariprofundaceae bacterium]|nr:DUF167 domain-containing protein [Mariprofundaceae bacterium]
MNEPECSAALTPANDGMYINIHAQPGARREALCGMHGDALKIAVRQAPEAGKANAAIVDFMADALHIPRKQIEVTAGKTSRRKRLFVHGDTAMIAGRVEALLHDA